MLGNGMGKWEDLQTYNFSHTQMSYIINALQNIIYISLSCIIAPCIFIVPWILISCIVVLCAHITAKCKHAPNMITLACLPDRMYEKKI